MGFSKNRFNFFKKVRGGKFAVECVSKGLFLKNVLSSLNMRSFGKKSENFERWKNRKCDEERVLFPEKTFSNFLKTSFTKMGRRKI